MDSAHLGEAIVAALTHPRAPNRAACQLLARRGYRSPETAARQLTQVLSRMQDPQSGERFASALLAELDECPDPELALAGFSRWIGSLASPRSMLQLLAVDPRALSDLVTLFSSSTYVAEVLERNPYAYDALFSRGQEPLLPRVSRDIDSIFETYHAYKDRLNALRRLRHLETLGIAWQDLTGRATFSETVRDISDLAQAIIQGALRLCWEDLARSDAFTPSLPPGSGPSSPPFPFAVFAMGKLGGRELNYSSDIDLLLVADAPEPGGALPQEAERLAERLVAALTEAGQDGYLYRTDLRLRPEGRYGPLVRSISSYREYYQNWMQPWERQSLIKARFVAGDEPLGRRFAEMVEGFVYPPDQDYGFLEDIRATKEALEAKVSSTGEAETNVKEGRGAIRDVEFAIQFLQLTFGAENPSLRVPGSLEALERLWEAGILPLSEAERLREAYIFLRIVEHRLQLMEDQPVRCLPADTQERRKLARRMGYPRGEEDRFDSDFLQHRNEVREVFTDLFNLHEEEAAPRQVLRGLLLSAETSSAQSQLREVLSAMGFRHPESSSTVLSRLMGTGSPLNWQVRRSLADIVGPLIHTAAQTADPDSALRILDSPAWQAELRNSRSPLREPGRLEILCRLGASGPVIPDLLAREPEVRQEILRAAAVPLPGSGGPSAPGPFALRGRAEVAAELGVRLAMARDSAAALDTIRRYKRRELLRVTLADVLADAGVAGEPVSSPHPDRICSALSDLADACLEGVLRVCARELAAAEDASLPLSPSGLPEGFAILGLGRLGGRELTYSSDLDLLCICRDPGQGHEAHRPHERLAESVYRSLNEISSSEGVLYEADFRLRPEGKSGPMAASLEVCRRYYRERAMTWERQAMLKARFIAGDEEVARAFFAVLEPWIYPEDPPEGLAEEVRAMKRRVERERVSGPQRAVHLKLGPGGLSDIEWTVQLLQMLHAGRHRALRSQSTVESLGAMASAEGVDGQPLLTEAEVRTLLDAYRFYVHLRNHLYLRMGTAQDALPSSPEEREIIAGLLGFGSAEALEERQRGAFEQVRAVARRRFWGQPD